VKFFYGVGQLDRIINIENIQIKKPSKTRGEEVEVEVECLATAFRAVKAGETPLTGPRKGPRGGQQK
jgi:type IV pilus assembly protein PilO